MRKARQGDNVIRIDLKEAEGHLGQLMEEAASGEEVIIRGRQGFTVRLVPDPGGADEDAEPRARTEPTRTVGAALDRFIGTWTAEDEAEVLGAVEVFERIDKSFWV